MKKWFVLLALVFVFGLTACQSGPSSIDGYQTMLEDAGYEIESISEEDMDEVAAIYGDFVNILGGSKETSDEESYGIVVEYEDNKEAKEFYDSIKEMLESFAMIDVEIKIVGKYIIMGDDAFMKALKL